ncbi:hypothetical protein BDQ17DRAFT_1430015 [Cyathus striatus]|nr:hypothetical protein BDQ17DRAFT_1430015 [Cyathus striatus]
MANAISPLKLNPDVTTPIHAKFVQSMEHSEDSSVAPATNKDISVSPTCSTSQMSENCSNSYDDYVAEVKAKVDARNREAFDQWQVSHYAFDFPKAGGRGGTIEVFLKLFVPSPVTVPSNPTVEKNITTLAGNIPATSETVTYGLIVKLLNKCQKDLPSAKKIAFADSSMLTNPSPTGYSRFTVPGILGSYPGQPALTSNHRWDKYSLAIECKFDADPVNQPANEVPAYSKNVETIAQLVRNGRNLLFASLGCYVFVIGTYCATRQMRIYRFDHSGSVSCGFSYETKPHILREFLWRIVNPHHGIPNTVVGWDETIRIPSDEDIAAMMETIKPMYASLKINKKYCRWIKVRLNRAAFKARMSETNLLSRAVDPRDTGSSLSDGSPNLTESSENSQANAGSHSKDSKDSRPEPTYNLTEVKDTKPNWIPGLAEYYGCLKLSDMSSHLSGIRGHTTISRRLLTGESDSDRVRVRVLTGPVGGHVADFVKTKDFVIVMRDAIIGHYIARQCGVLHRDISIGNILVENIGCQVRGFLHDFDHATFYECDLDSDKEKAERKDMQHDLKTLTGTRQFMATEVLKMKPHKPHHDLESCYWVMVFTFLRHSAHNHELDAEACTSLFDHSKRYSAMVYKHSWLAQCSEPLEIPSNRPLTDLMKDLRRIFRTYHMTMMNHPRHEQLVQTMDMNLKAPGWPSSDSSVCHKWSKEQDDNKSADASVARCSSRFAALNAAEADIPPEEPAPARESSTVAAQAFELPGYDSDGLEADGQPTPDENSPIERQFEDAKEHEPSEFKPASWRCESRKRKLPFDDSEEHVGKKSRGSGQ